jgi:hypothetical protein
MSCPHCYAHGTLIVVAMTRNMAALTESFDFQCTACGYQGSFSTPRGFGFVPDLPELEAKEPEPEPPVIHGAALGYRAWRIKDWQLIGTGVNRAWHPGVNEATCDPGPGGYTYGGMGRHPAPADGCACGITALARFAPEDTHWAGADVYGAIEAWSDDTPDSEPGRFILHGTGFRAQYGKVVLLTVEEDWPAAKKAAVRTLAHEHEADVCKRSHLEDAAKEHGQLVSDELLAWATEGESESNVVPGGGGYLSGGYLVPPMMFGAAQQAGAYLSSSPSPASMWSISTATASPPKLKTKKGIRETLGYPGPPSQGKFCKGDRVRDCNNATWVCVRGGRPGVWDPE